MYNCADQLCLHIFLSSSNISSFIYSLAFLKIIYQKGLFDEMKENSNLRRRLGFSIFTGSGSKRAAQFSLRIHSLKILLK